MKKFDLIVIGSGSGLDVAGAASEEGMKVAIVEKGPMGGTCLNRGCIPSKMLIHSANVAETIKTAEFFGIESKGFEVNWKKIISRVTQSVDKDSEEILDAINKDENTTLFQTHGKFIGDRTMQVGSEEIFGEKVVIAGGTRATVPTIKGIDTVDYMTSRHALRLEEQPKSLIIMGGGYVACELGHFYGALGTDVTIVQRNKRLVPAEDEEISEAFTKIYSEKYHVFTEHTVEEVQNENGRVKLTAKNSTGENVELVADKLLVAIGRVPNTDVLEVEKTGVEVKDNGHIKTNEFMETTASNIWALGDIVGNYLFKHSANLEAQFVVNNLLNPDHKRAVDYTAMPHAVFGSPQIAGVGHTKQELVKAGIDFAEGRYQFIDSAMGDALNDKDGFIKVYISKEDKSILGCHIMGTEASTLIHEVIVTMKANQNMYGVINATHIHPALSEVVDRAFGEVEF
ncbi:MAG: dihydrolipoyl dehydrogenase [Bacteroidetes bacterium]|nr:dihydrolipoyl dehydrogenase [Bacteroidota bacterium]